MSSDSVRRSILRQGFIVLLIGFATGFGVVAGGTSARAWLGTHLTIMLTAVFMILVGLVWNDLALSERQRRIFLPFVFSALVLYGLRTTERSRSE